MNFRKRLLLLISIAVILLVVPYFYHSVWNSTVPGPPYVYGWNRNTSKNVRHYISETLAPRILPKNFCKTEGLLLVVVNIKPDGFEARNAIRETWARKHGNITFYFLLGEDKDRNYEVQLAIQDENEQYNDIIQENFIDTYNNLTLKSINMLKLFYLHCSKSYKYLLKIDDDVFLNVENLYKMLKLHDNTKNLLVGKLISNTTPFRDPDNKWYVPYELYPEDKYPDYLCGPAYVMSTDVAEKLYRCTLETPIFHIEDVYITGICAKKMNIIPQHNQKFTCPILYTKYICVHKHLISLHYHSPAEMRKSYKILKDNYCWPPNSIMELLYSLFY